jgi:hypothetical protein
LRTEYFAREQARIKNKLFRLGNRKNKITPANRAPLPTAEMDERKKLHSCNKLLLFMSNA